MPGFTEKEGENFPYEHSVMQFKSETLPLSICQYHSKPVMKMWQHTSSQTTTVAKFSFLPGSSVEGWVPLAFWPVLEVLHIFTLWRPTQVWEGMSAPLQWGGSSCWVTETGGAAGHAISASPPVNQGSCITPTENTERPLTTNKELDHDWDSRNIHMLGKKHAVFQVC